MKKRKFDFDFEDIILRTAGFAMLAMVACGAYETVADACDALVR